MTDECKYDDYNYVRENDTVQTHAPTIDTYNTAARALEPLMPMLTWEQVYFKLLRAHKEIKRLNVEIPRVVTWIADENRVLCRAERVLRSPEGKSREKIEVDIGMAVQLALYHQQRGRFDDTHMQRFWALAKTPGFTGSLKPGISKERRAVQDALQKARTELARLEGDEMEVDERTLVVDAAAGGWRRDDNDEWEDTAEEEGQV
ncbi:hypothetical protein B0H15DRAFT_807000 [Mycena belliarum]|uniref:Uncharacterized protein n=1 Tax=Mycena belliarum TaxID=1033014 RepID=A0AAD6TPM7_9AGAR|nr:hypothetical protein B0H15DRAFT_807000 [Mycena belliae]